DKAISIDQNNFLAWNNRGFANFENEAYAEAISDFKKVNLLKPDYAIAYSNSAGVYMKMDEYEQAVKYSTIAIEKDKDLGIAYYNRAIAYEMLRQEIKACEDF